MILWQQAAYMVSMQVGEEDPVQWLKAKAVVTAPGTGVHLTVF